VFYSYTYAVAPKGQEGRYFALANVPLFAPKIFAGVLSGVLFEKYCTGEEGNSCEHPQLLWFWIFAAAAPFPVGLWLLKRWIGSRYSTRTLQHP
jgi:hypothetical protein